jgi:glycosyltransferase involved in cell wall biosynthesis
LGRIFDGWSHRPLQTRVDGGATVRRVWVYAAMGSGVKRIVNYLSFGVTSLLGLAATPRSRWVLVEYPTLFGALPAVVVARLRGQRVVVIVADLWVDAIVEIGTLSDGGLVALLRRLERWMLRRATAVTAVTEGVRDALVAKGVDPARLVWLPNGADTEMFRPGTADPALRRRLGVAEDEHVFLYAGTHGYVHGLDVVLDAAVLLSDEPVRFVLVGDGSEKAALRARAERLHLDNVQFLDPVSPEEVAELLRVATGALATVRAGDAYRAIRSAKAIPAMASGRAVVYSGDDEGSRLVAEIGAGLVVPPEDPVRLAEAVRALVADPELRERLGEAGRRWVVEHASWHRLVGQWLDELDALELGPSVGAVADGARP